MSSGGFMEEIKTFIIDNSKQIWTLLSVVIGGVVTYISTSASERRKIKRQNQKENLEQILIPYCTCLEQTITRINQAYIEPIKLSTDKIFENWLSALSEPLVYLEAAKRVFLSKSMREKLNNYKYKFEKFFADIERECEICLVKYKNYISKKLMAFPDVLQPMFISFSMDKNTSTKVKIAIINHKNLSLINDFSKIDFVINDDPDEYVHTAVNLSDEIRDTWSTIRCGEIDISEIDTPEIKIACSLLEYIEENIFNEQVVISKIIAETQGANELIELTDNLNKMHKELIKTIDKITN